MKEAFPMQHKLSGGYPENGNAPPILFCIDGSNNDTDTPLTPENLASKKEDFNSLVTFKELRRAYKLCEEIDDKEIRDVAKRSFKFVKVNVPSDEDGRKKFRSEEHTSELQSQFHLVCRLLLEKKKKR